MDTPTVDPALMLLILAICGIIFVALLVPTIFFLLALQRALALCAPPNRSMSPGQVWLLLIPIFSLGWNFVVVNALSDSLHKEFMRRGIRNVPEPGKSIGTAYAILVLLSAVPYVGILTAIPAIVCWILYWIEIAKHSRVLEFAPEPATI